MTTAPMDVTILADTLLDRLDRRWRRPDLTFSVMPFRDKVMISIAPADPAGRHGYVLKHHLLASELLVLERQGGLDDVVAAILRSADCLGSQFYALGSPLGSSTPQ